MKRNFMVAAGVLGFGAGGALAPFSPSNDKAAPPVAVTATAAQMPTQIFWHGHDHFSALMRAAATNDSWGAMTALRAGEIDMETQGGQALQLAATHGHLPVVRVLLLAGVPANALNDAGFVAAATAGHDALAVMLAEHAAPSADNMHRALISAAQGGRTALIEKLAATGADITAQDNAVFIAAALAGQDGTVGWLLQQKTIERIYDDAGAPYGHDSYSHMTAARIEEEGGCMFFHEDGNYNGGMAHDARTAGYIDFERRIVNIDAQNGAALTAAAAGGHLSTLRQLVTAGADYSTHYDAIIKAAQTGVRDGRPDDALRYLLGLPRAAAGANHSQDPAAGKYSADKTGAGTTAAPAIKKSGPAG